MPYDIQVRLLGPQTMLSLRQAIRPSELARFIADALKTTHDFLAHRGGAPAGPPFTIYHAVSDQQMVVEVGIPTATLLEAADGLGAGDLYAGRAAMTTHVGPYDTLTDAYRALNEWIVQHGEQAAGSPWESYVTDPAGLPPEQVRTNVYWPIK